MLSIYYAMWSNLLRYIFWFLWVLLIILLVIIDKLYVTEQPIPDMAYWIVATFIVWCMIGADNLTNIISLFINKYLWNDKDKS